MGSTRKKSCALSCLLTEGEVLLSWYISVNLETACMNSGNSNGQSYRVNQKLSAFILNELLLLNVSDISVAVADSS